MIDHPNLTAKHREIVGHQEGCFWTTRTLPTDAKPADPVCTCPPPSKDELVAVVFGDLETKHVREWDPKLDEWYCTRCDAHEKPPDYELVKIPGPCAPPIDDARAWRMLEWIAPVLREHRLYKPVAHEAWTHLSLVFAGRPEDAHALTPESVAAKFLTLAEAGMLKEGK